MLFKLENNNTIIYYNVKTIIFWKIIFKCSQDKILILWMTLNKQNIT